MTDRPIYGLVLAGGESRRMGTDKALLDNGGESQLSRAVRLLGRHVDEVFVSTREAQKDEPERARFRQILDRYDALGPVAGILSAMDAHPDVDWLVLACDLPNVDDETIARLLAQRKPGRPFVAYRSSHNGLPEPLCSIYANGSRSIVEGFVSEAVHCPRKMMINSDTQLLDQPAADALDNLNTPEDLASSRLGSPI